MSSSASLREVVDKLERTNECASQQKEKHIPRPMNSFMLFRREKQREIASKCQGANHRDMSKVISKWWRELSQVEKQPYIDEADRLQLEHKKKYPGYKFTPKRKTKAPRRYKRCPADQLVARNFDDKQTLLSLYYNGIIENDKQQPLHLQNKLDISLNKQIQKKNHRLVDSSSNNNTTNVDTVLTNRNICRSTISSPNNVDTNQHMIYLTVPSALSNSANDFASSGCPSRFATPLSISLSDSRCSSTPYSVVSEDDTPNAYPASYYFGPQPCCVTANPISMLTSAYHMRDPVIDLPYFCCETAEHESPMYNVTNEHLLPNNMMGLSFTLC
ncbi:hypothetical protein BDF20DRAFT_864650 [Mycotypha africana]|uniref:uncharacterized protein n=1 Tax=Mycotypha africana TaxID=64632 RepID=UPI0023016BBE|nr:uncharacterized protein BDF20DRAFT_864650 [Mycotypha africana]KAI8982036.1 hypothetical protein BDF20DRAFT_864650 [Mycotypha africana]